MQERLYPLHISGENYSPETGYLINEEFFKGKKGHFPSNCPMLYKLTPKTAKIVRDFLEGSGDNFGRAKGATSAQSGLVSGLRKALCVG